MSLFEGQNSLFCDKFTLLIFSPLSSVRKIFKIIRRLKLGIEYPKNLSTKTLTFYAHFSIFYFFLKTVLESAKNSESNSFFFKIFYKILLTELKTKK